MTEIDLTEAVDAALDAYKRPRRMLVNTSDGGQHNRMEAALDAALPFIREQLAQQLDCKRLDGRRQRRDKVIGGRMRWALMGREMGLVVAARIIRAE